MKNNFGSAFDVTKRFWLLSIALLFLNQVNFLKAQDIGVEALVVPSTTICGSTNYPIVVSVANKGALALDFASYSAVVTVNISGASSQSFTYTLTGTLGAYASQNYTITNLADMTAAGTHTFDAYSTMTNDINAANDAMIPVNVVVNPSPVIVGYEPNPSICDGVVMAAFSYASSPPGATYTWTNDQTSIGLAASGSGDRPAFTAVNMTGSPVIANIMVQPTLNGCTGGSLGYFIQVDPLPIVTVNSPVICAGQTAALTAAGAASYSWTAGAVSTGINTADASPAATASYTVTGSSSGCTGTAVATVTVNPSPVVTVNSPAICDGQTAALTATGAATYYWSPGSYTASTVNVAPTGTTTYTITGTDASGCSGTAFSTVTVYPNAALTLISVAGTDAQTACSNTALTDIIYSVSGGGTGASAAGLPPGVMGSFAGGVFTITGTPTTSAGSPFTYTVTTTGTCAQAAATGIITVNAMDIRGHVSYSGGNLSSGNNKAVLLRYLTTLLSFDTVQVITLDAAGNYNFSLVDQGNYLIKVFPDTAAYPLLVPTYYGNVYLWDSALTVVHGCTLADTANVVMIETSSATGPGLISGHITEGAGYGRAPGDPVPGIDIKLGRNPGGQLFSNTVTNSNGDYAFNNVPVNITGESYTVFVDVPGLGRDSSYTVVVTAANSQFNSLNYLIDSTTIHEIPAGTVGITNAAAKENRFSVYPNPSKGNVSIEYTLLSEAKVSLCVYNVLGIKVLDLLNTRQSAGIYKFNVDAKESNLNSGIYFITLVKDGKPAAQRLVITE